MAHYLAVHYYDLDEGDKELIIFKNMRHGIECVKRVYMDSSDSVTGWTDIIKMVRNELKLAPMDDSSIIYENVVR